MKKFDKADIGELLKSLESAKHQVVSDDIAGVAWIQEAIGNAIIHIQLLEQELYSSDERLCLAELELEELKGFVGNVFQCRDAADCYTDEERERFRMAIAAVKADMEKEEKEE